MSSHSSSTSRRDASVYVVDHHDAAREALVNHIDRAPGFVVIGSCTDARVAVDEMAVLRPDIAVIDAGIGDVDGLDVCREIRRQVPELACVVTTVGLGTPWTSGEAVAAGASAVLVKQLSDFPLISVLSEVAAQSDGGANR